MPKPIDDKEHARRLKIYGANKGCGSRKIAKLMGLSRSAYIAWAKKYGVGKYGKEVERDHEHICYYNPKNQTCLTCQKAVYKTTKEPECDGYNYPGEHVGTFAVFDHKYIRINCPHWQAKESEVEEG